MGKPYRTELYALPATYQWAMQCPVDALIRFFRAASSGALLCVGSGGSLSVAHLAARLHQELFGKLARATTPLDSVSSQLDWTRLAVLILTAGGGNPDVLGAFESLRRAEPHAFGVLCCRPGSPLCERAQEHRSIQLQTLGLPTGKDGFLATNTLLASAVVLVRAITGAAGVEDGLPDSLQGLMCDREPIESYESGLRAECRSLWSRQTLIVLHGPATQPAAVDIESKLVEAALGNVQLADYRNFAHGRHHWLARYKDETALLALSTEGERALAERTLRLLPQEIPAARIVAPGEGVAASLSSLVIALYLAGLAGEARGHDPGAPHVPDFGRKLYHLNAYTARRSSEASRLEDRAAIAIERKSRISVGELKRRGLLGGWRSAHDEFVASLRQARFRALILDYDGTICEPCDRVSGITAELAARLAELLGAGLFLGIASGRGGSVREDLQGKLPRKLWDRVLVGYYNGSATGALGDDSVPDKRAAPHPALIELDERIRGHGMLSSLASPPELRPMQLSIRADVALPAVWRLLTDLLAEPALSCLRVVTSSHSIDVLAPGVTKRAVLGRVREASQLELGAPVLCIGDRGELPGNDFELLREPCSLSVDEVSPDPASCWNLSPRGHRGVVAASWYLSTMTVRDGILRVRPDADGGAER